MKNFILIIGLIYCSTNLSSQNYHKLIEPNKNWYVIYHCTQCGGYDHHRKYFFEGDTLINGVPYTILKAEVYKGYINYPLEPPEGFIYNIGYLREDTLNRKVYYYYLKSRHQHCESQELLLYDFNLSINDTFKTIIPCYSLDSCFYLTNRLNNIESLQLKNGEIINNFIFDHGSYSEYLGNSFPLPIDTFYTCIANYEYTFICLKKNNEPIHGDLCNLVYSNELSQNVTDIYPNPASTTLTINNPSNEKLRMLIFNINGIKMLEKELYSNHETITIQELSAGIFFYKIVNEERVLQNGKLIKNY